MNNDAQQIWEAYSGVSSAEQKVIDDVYNKVVNDAIGFLTDMLAEGKADLYEILTGLKIAVQRGTYTQTMASAIQGGISTWVDAHPEFENIRGRRLASR